MEPLEMDRILIDLFDWLRRIIFWRAREVKRIPFRVIQVKKGKAGLLKMVERDTQRAVRTYIFTPFPKHESFKASKLYDYHLCLDSLSNLDTRWACRIQQDTHRITILKASHWLGERGTFQAQTLFLCDYPIVRRDSATMDRWAIAILGVLAHLVMEFGVDEIDWHREIEDGRKQYLGRYYHPVAQRKPSP